MDGLKMKNKQGGIMEKNEIVTQEEKKELSPSEMMQMTLQNGGDLDKLEKLLLLQERWEKNNAIKAYNKAMAEFKANPPKIDKDRKVSYSTAKGKTEYHHASLFNVVDKITAELGKHGLSSSWRTAQNGKDIVVTCRISHSMGHYEETSLTGVADDSGSKNSIQAVGSTIAYLSRYTILALTGLATQDQDNDCVTEEEKIDDNKISIINNLLTSLSIDKNKFLEYMSVEKIEDIKSSQFAKAKMMLESRKK